MLETHAQRALPDASSGVHRDGLGERRCALNVLACEKRSFPPTVISWDAYRAQRLLAERPLHVRFTQLEYRGWFSTITCCGAGRTAVVSPRQGDAPARHPLGYQRWRRRLTGDTAPRLVRVPPYSVVTARPDAFAGQLVRTEQRSQSGPVRARNRALVMCSAQVCTTSRHCASSADPSGG